MATSIKFTCDVCSKSYKTEENRRAHMLFEHQILRPICQNYDLINNRNIAEANLINDYRSHLRYFKGKLLDDRYYGYSPRIPIQEFIKLVSFEKKLKEFNLPTLPDSNIYKPIKDMSEMYYQSLYKTPIPSSYKIEYPEWGVLPQRLGESAIFVNRHDVYQLTLTEGDLNGLYYREDLITEWKYK